jgi:hypothetical protein
MEVLEEEVRSSPCSASFFSASAASPRTHQGSQGALARGGRARGWQGPLRPPPPSLFCCFVRRGLHLQSDVAQFSRLLPRTQFIKEIEILFGQFLRSRSLCEFVRIFVPALTAPLEG